MHRSNSQRFRRSLLGYRKRDVDEAVAELSTRLHDAEQTSDMSAVVGRHLGDLLTRFADAVDEGERDARAAADALVTDARAEATAVFEAARRHYEAHAVARRSAMSQLEGALGQMSDALALADRVAVMLNGRLVQVSADAARSQCHGNRA